MYSKKRRSVGLNSYIRLPRLHRFSRLPLEKLIAVPKQKPRALLQALGFLIFDRLHTPMFLFNIECLKYSPNKALRLASNKKTN